MNKTKWIIIVVLALVLVIISILAVFKTDTDRTTSCFNPVLSNDGKILAYWKYENLPRKDSVYKEGDNASSDDGAVINLRTLDFNKRERKTFFSIPLKLKEDAKIDGVSELEIAYSITDYSSGSSNIWLFSPSLGVSEFIRTDKDAVFKNEVIPSPLDANLKLNLSYISEDKSSLTLSSESGSYIKILEVPAYQGYIYEPKWVGENIVFQAHVKQNSVFCNQLWFYQTGSGVLSLVSKNCSSYMISDDGKNVALLIPSKAKGKELWEMSVKSFSNREKIKDLDTVCYEEEVFLYEWSPSNDGFLMQRGNSLCFYDIKTMKLKELQNAEKDGWWGYPLSMYYVAFNGDGTKVAALNYREASENSGFLESITLIDIKFETKKRIYENLLPEFGKKQPFKPEFYKHILWSKFNGHIIFESKKPDNPELKRIMSISEDGSKKKNLSSSIF